MKVNTTQLTDAAQQLKNECARLQQVNAELYLIQKKLWGCSEAMDKTAWTLDRYRRRFSGQKDALQALTSALENLAGMYEQCEKNNDTSLLIMQQLVPMAPWDVPIVFADSGTEALEETFQKYINELMETDA